MKRSEMIAIIMENSSLDEYYASRLLDKLEDAGMSITGAYQEGYGYCATRWEPEDD